MTGQQVELPGMSIVVEQKRCGNCGKTKPLSEFHKHKITKDGHRGRCKECRREDSKRYHWDHHEEQRARSKRWYEEHAEQIKRYRQEHVEEMRIKDRLYYQAHKEERKAKSRRYYAEHKEMIHDVYYEANKERILARSKRWRDEHPDYAKQRYRANPEKARERNQRHRAAKANLPGDFTGDEWLALCDEYDVCPCCKKPWVECGPPTIDHVIPVSWLGASNDISALQPLCASCNAAKGNRHATDYRNNTPIKERE